MSYYLERIQCGVDYIEARLDREIPLQDVAKAAGISQWHFQRMFKALTGETLKGYIRGRRLAGSLEHLLTSQLRVLDIALIAGFESQEAFARAFKQAFDLTPQQYRSLGDKSLFLKKVSFDPEYLRHINQNLSLTPEIYKQPRLLLVGKRTLFYSVDSEKNNIAERLVPLWQSFLPHLSEIEQRVSDYCYGVVRQEAPDSDRLEYHAATAVTAVGKLPEGFVAFDLPAGKYAKFAHRGPARDVNHTVNYAYSTWLAQSEYRHTYAPDLEIYGADYHPTSADSLLHYSIPIG
ncbi:MAG TPA: GyrI-like domain-containing protein [Polyangiaceae bacterium]|nr:GyrI-like domain-containing protein [Polyangiaceae bacterium]